MISTIVKFSPDNFKKESNILNLYSSLPSGIIPYIFDYLIEDDLKYNKIVLNYTGIYGEDTLKKEINDVLDFYKDNQDYIIVCTSYRVISSNGLVCKKDKSILEELGFELVNLIIPPIDEEPSEDISVELLVYTNKIGKEIIERIKNKQEE